MRRSSNIVLRAAFSTSASRSTPSSCAASCGTDEDDLGTGIVEEVGEKEAEQREKHNIAHHETAVFLEVAVRDPSEFETNLIVVGEERFGYRILRAEGATGPRPTRWYRCCGTSSSATVRSPR